MHDAKGIDARSDETAQQAQPAGQEPGPQGSPGTSLETELRAALARATAGDWFAVEAESMKYCSAVEFEYVSGARGSIGLVCKDGVTVGASELDQQNDNARFIALAKNHMGELLDTLSALRAQVEAKDAVLREARAIIQQELDHLLSCCCLISEGGKPIRETLEDGPSETVLGMEAALSKIDAVLGGGHG